MKFSFKSLSKGFTLIEVMVSILIFAIIMTAVAQIFSRAFVGYRSTRAVQRDTENAQYVLNALAKELRTSSVVDFGEQGVTFYDYSQDICFRYRISNNSLQIASVEASDISMTASEKVAECGGVTFGSFKEITTGAVSGKFAVTQSDASVMPKTVGKITVSLQIKEGETHTASIQTTTSLRDYAYIEF